MNIIVFIFVFFVLVVRSSFNVDDYPDYELENPQNIFIPIQYTGKLNHPKISKLIFITPWNHEGKRLTIKYANKLKYISPCWYQLIPKNGKIIFQNNQLIDHEYIQQVKSANPNVKIIPRVYVSNFEVLRQIGMKRQAFEEVLDLITQTVSKYEFDGIVWDSPYDLFVDDQNMNPLNRLIHQFVNSLKNRFQSLASSDRQILLFFNMANPSKRKLNNHLYKTLRVDGMLIQNYDSPLDFIQMIKNSVDWVKNAKPSAKEVIMMLAFFSYKNGQGISTVDAKKELEREGIFSHGFERGMCKFLSQKKGKYLVPCYKYFSQAYKILQEAEYSAGFWQGGNGLQNYYLFM